MPDDQQPPSSILNHFAKLGTSEQQENLERVHARIARHVLAFFAKLEREGRVQFRGEELLLFVESFEKVAPDSPGRIMRQLRRDGRLCYEVISRKDSLYQRGAPQ